MTDGLPQIVVWLNSVGNAAGRLLLSPIAFVPGWLSATVSAVVAGILMLIAFKYTSNQRGIKAARDDIKAHMLALKLFKDNAAVTLHALGRILLGAGKLLVYAIVPMLVMAVPVTMLLAQLALWYQARPLQVGEEAVVTVKLAGNASSSWPEVILVPTEALAVSNGPLRIKSKREICWDVQARAPGQHHVVFRVDGLDVDKELAIGDGFMRVSTERPEWSWSAALFNPWEQPFRPDSPVQSIEIVYPKRSSWTCGSDSWVIYWFVVSIVAAFFCRGLLGVNV